jgi:hypothetical protein
MERTSIGAVPVRVNRFWSVTLLPLVSPRTVQGTVLEASTRFR